jgi:predicted Abi (CAAX) family protease
MFFVHHDKIQSLIEKHLMSALENKADSDKAEQYMKLQKLHFRLLCQVRPSGVIDRVRQIKRNEIKLAPVDCLDICE